MAIRVGVVGFGLAGRVFHAPLIASVEGLELAAVVERSADNAAGRYPEITTYRTLEALLADASVDLVVVATPNANHFEAARQALEAGKSVVVDKPVSVTSVEIAELTALAAAKNLLLVPFHNRRWDSDFRTISNLVHEKSLGRIVSFHSHFDRWRPLPRPKAAWKDDPAQGGLLLDIGTHLADQALALLGLPMAVGADVVRERDGEGGSDSFTVRLRYERCMVELAANVLSALPRPRFHLRGTKGNYWKWGLDQQETELGKVTRIDSGSAWGEEPPEAWGTLGLDGDGGVETRLVEPVAGDYRLFYAGVRDALLGVGPAPVTALAAWRVARLLEWAAESAALRREVVCDWSLGPGLISGEPPGLGLLSES